MRRLVKGVGMAAISAVLLMTGLSVGHAGFSYVACAEDSDFVIEDGVLTEYTGDGGDVVIPDGVTSIGDKAFYYCDSITSIEIPNSVTSIEDFAFCGCSNLRYLVIPDSVTSIGYHTFYNCNLSFVRIPNTITNMDVNAFTPYYCTTSFCYTGSKEEWEKLDLDINGGTFYYNCFHVLDDCYITDDGTLLFYVGNQEKINVPNGVTCIGASAFYKCNNLTSISIPNGVKSIDNYAFSGCSNLTMVEIPTSVTSIAHTAFSETPWLNEKLQESPLVIVNGILFYASECEGELIIPDGVTTIGESVFVANRELTSVVMPDSVTSIGSGAFYYCYGLSEIKLSKNLISIGNSAFISCGFTSLAFPEGLTSIGNDAFEDCSLTNIIIPKSITNIGENAFYSCSKLTDVYYGGTEADWAMLNYSFVEDGAKNCTIHYALDKTVISKISNTTSGVTFSWNKVDGATGYRVYRKTGSSGYTLYKKITSADTTSFTDTAVTGGTTYTYAVRAYDAMRYSSFTGKSIKYLAPASVSTLVNYSKGIQVKWSKITGASGYYIYRKAGSETKWSRVATVTSGSTLKWNDTNTTAGLKYQYCIKAYSGSTMGAYKAGKTTYRVTTPSISSVTNSAAGKATVKWNKNTSATGYQISYTTGSTTKTITVSGNTNVSKVISGLTKGKTYTVKVRSYRKVGTTYYYSTWSSAKSVKITK